MSRRNWIKTTSILAALFVIGWIAPAHPIDPWNLFSLKNIGNLIFALAFVQAIGSLLNSLFGSKTSVILTGFLGGLVSSTATTASLARQSEQSSRMTIPESMVIFLSATLAMLLEGLAITFLGITDIHWSLLILFSGPIFLSLGMIFFYSRQTTARKINLQETPLDLLPILKLALYVFVVLTLSKILQNILGNAGWLVLTFIVSLFEIHGSVIANLQLHDSGAISVRFLGGLLAVSILASYCSKLFLVLTLGSRVLKTKVVKLTLLLVMSLAASGLFFYWAE